MKRLYLLLLFTGIIISSFAQHISRDVTVVPAKSEIPFAARSLEAKFTSDITSGPAPLTVHFTDQSTGNPTSWNWDFGDGGTDTIQNPVHTFATIGVYTVKLTISNGLQIYSLEKKDYITVTVNYNGCDTLHYPLPEPLTYYVLIKNNVSKGYVSGNNAYGDKAIADYFDNTSPDMAIKGAMLEFSHAVQAAFNNETITVKAWKYDSIKESPGDLLGTASVSLSEIISDVAALHPTQVEFEDALTVSGPFFLGVELPQQVGDTLVLWTTKTGVTPPNTGWVLQSNNEWAPYDSLYTNPLTLVLTNAIYPIICHTSNGVKDPATFKYFIVSPNPATDFLRIESRLISSKNARYELITATGEKIINGTFASLPGNEIINISTCKPGLYFLRITYSGGATVKRVIIR